VQLLQLKYGRDNPDLRQANTLAALEALFQAGHLAGDDFKFLTESYRFLRTIEGRLRLMNTTSRDDLPEEPIEQSKLARRLGFSEPAALLEQCQAFAHGNQERFERLLNAES
jgi:glutamate-ammonia-ligase adenylyltransferase